MTHLTKVQNQFGPAAIDYVNCPVQSGDYTIHRLLQLVKPKKSWRVLDVATGGGHTAIAIAPYVHEVLATDVTHEMLVEAKNHADKLGCANIKFEYSDATELPFGKETFDLITCRLAAHHFEDVPKFLSICNRLLKHSGILAIVDSHLPSDVGGDYINEIQRLHDPSHVRCLSKEEWVSSVENAKFSIQFLEEGKTKLKFNTWASRARVSVEVGNKLKKMMLTAPAEASKILEVDHSDESDLKFFFQRIIVIAEKT